MFDVNSPENTRVFLGNEIRANYEVWLVALRHFAGLLPAASPSLNAPYDKDRQSNPREVFAHTIIAAYFHIDWCATQLKIAREPISFEELQARMESATDIKSFQREFALVAEWVYATMQNTTDEDLPSESFLAPWGEGYSVIGMFEHSTVHVLRHLRQMVRMLKEGGDHPISPSIALETSSVLP